MLICLLLLPVTAAAHNGFTDIAVNELHQNGFNGLIIDVRSATEYAEGHVPGAINIPFDKLDAHLATLGSISQPMLVYCRSGRRAGIALQSLAQLGYTSLSHLDGDMLQWQASQLPVTSSHE
ncbi:hypothetical protein BFC17_06165 [Alteromonas lipolytica]|uniref:Rhodanese domain-containing protein n=1 Tax=Alteromonas lipolytica TaxID=1856405 RepID=A0A1E8FBF9_9ALTE|nr:hypothetical protein BFC17_06165 [Alteromonas lipolytica]